MKKSTTPTFFSPRKTRIWDLGILDDLIFGTSSLRSGNHANSMLSQSLDAYRKRSHFDGQGTEDLFSGRLGLLQDPERSSRGWVASLVLYWGLSVSGVYHQIAIKQEET